MKKILAVLLLLVLLLSGCSKTPAIDYSSIIRAEVLPTDSPLSKAIAEAVTLKVDKIEEGQITLTVTAPDITADALAWFDSVSEADYTNEGLETQLLTLLKGEKTARSFTLEVEGEQVRYTDEFLSAASGGVRPFYAILSARLLDEMEASVND